MGVKLVSSSGGSVEINPPTTASNFTATMPAGTGTVAVQGISGVLVSGTAQASTSGTSIDFTGIPSWVKRVTVLFSGVSTSGTANYFVRIGSGSIQSTGYTSTASYMTTTPSTASDTTSFIIRSDNASNNICGAMVMYNISGNTWVETWAGGGTGNNQSYVGGGAVTLSGALDRLRITTSNGTDTFDAGSINILYE